MPTNQPLRGHWTSRMGFILAAAGSAVGLGNIWKFPYIAGENGGGLFVLVYLGCIALVGLPIMIAEILVGRSSQKSPVGAFKHLAGPKSSWRIVGWMGVLSGVIILSFYSVVAGWALHYIVLSVKGAFMGRDAEAIGAIFGELYSNPGLNVFWQGIFMGLTVAIVISGVHKGLERWNDILMPSLLVMLIVLLIRAATLEGFKEAIHFVFAPNAENLTRAGVLEALGHSFFTLSLGMGAILTYGSYLDKDVDIVGATFAICFFDTVIALMACLILFPITFTYGMDPGAGPGLVFQNLPVAFSQMPFGMFWAAVFFTLLVFAALTSAISLLEVAVSYFIDEQKWERKRATVVCGGAIFILGIPSALSGGTELFGGTFAGWTKHLGFHEGKNWFDFSDYLSSNWMLPLGGLFIAIFAAWRINATIRADAFKTGSRWHFFFTGWLRLLRYLVPLAVVLVFLHLLGVL